jgi:hypothetical protein
MYHGQVKIVTMYHGQVKIVTIDLQWNLY